MAKLVSVLIVTHNRSRELFETIENVLEQTYANRELIVVENGSDPAVCRYNREHCPNYPGLKYHVLKENRGVSGGRNFALAQARGDYVVELDDDAIFCHTDAIGRIVDFMDDHPRVGIVAFKITDQSTGQVGRWDFPFRNKSRDKDLPGLCAWFIGAGHAFGRNMLDQVGFYRDFAPWGEEEQDLALRALDTGFDIYYFPEVGIVHKRSPHGRISPRWRWGAIHLKNKLKVPLLNLPWTSVLTYAVIRIPLMTWHYRAWRVPFAAVVYLAREWRYLVDNRKCLKPQTLRKLSALGGHRYY